MPSMTQTGAQWILSGYNLAIADNERFLIETLRVLGHMARTADERTVAVFAEELAWFLDSTMTDIQSDFLPPLFIPYHVAREIARVAKLRSRQGFMETIVTLKELGYEVENPENNDFRGKNPSADYREFSSGEIERLAKKILKANNGGSHEHS